MGQQRSKAIGYFELAKTIFSGVSNDTFDGPEFCALAFVGPYVRDVLGYQVVF